MIWLIVLAVIAMLCAHVLAAIYCAELFTRSKRRRVEGTPGDLGLRYEEVQFDADDDTLLRGWYLESPGARGTVVLAHDTDGTRADRHCGLFMLQRDYLRRGFHVMAFDLRGRGESGGVRDYFGALEQQDLAAAVSYARERAEALPVVLHGFGLGAALTICALAEGLEVDAAIADSPFTSARAYLRRRWAAVPAPTFRLALRIARGYFGADADATQPLRAITHMPEIPLLFIHGKADRLVPLAHTLNVAGAALTRRVEVWAVPGVGHCAAYLHSPDAYLRHCMDFIDSVLSVRRINVAAV
ncbi:MAG: alpha/beta hydrolase [Chloroflexi bacterium]|nr:alpha/beta hydrolase [Chloroflexota bacterium]